MKLFEAIVDANQRAARCEKAGLRPNDFADSLPIVALTCIDPRLNPLMPEVLGIPEEHFIWLRNAGNIVTGPTSSTVRSLALACAVKGGREIAIIGHTDCRVRQTSASELIERFKALGVERSKLPDNMNEFFGLFASERANVLKAADLVRQSPLIGRSIPVHGLLVDIQTGAVEWLVNGYKALGSDTAPSEPQATWALPAFDLGAMNFPEMKIGELKTQVESVAAAKPVLKVRTSPKPPPLKT
jgi:carbonic anhydrase